MAGIDEDRLRNVQERSTGDVPIYGGPATGAHHEAKTGRVPIYGTDARTPPPSRAARREERTGDAPVYGRSGAGADRGARAGDVPGYGPASGRGRPQKPSRTERVETEKQMLSAGLKGGITGSKLGAKAGSVVPGLGTGAGTAIGAAAGASVGQANTARKAGNPGRAFATAMPLGGVVGGAVNAKLAKDVRTAREIEQAEASGEARAAQPDGAEVLAKKPLVSQRIKDSKVSQTVQSESFRAGAKRVVVEVVRDAATTADRARASHAQTKGVAAAAAKGVATGAYRGVHAERANRPRAQAEPETTDEWLSDTASRTRSAGRPVSETYDYRFEGEDQQGVGRQYGD